jgi:hypothetical protein
MAMPNYQELSEECEQIRRESQEKEVLIQNLMEKINYL